MLNKSQQVKKRALEVFNQLDKVSCKGIDDYNSTTVYHSMADALLIQSAYSLKKAECITQAREKQVVLKALNRLLDNTLEQQGLKGWGLGFAWNDLPNNEIFTITTSIVLKAVSSYVTSYSEAKKIVTIAQIFLTSGAINKNLMFMIKAPIYSIGVDEHITNTWIYSLAALKSSAKVNTIKAKILSYLATYKYKGSVGWTYSQNNKRVDFLHQAYICSSLLDLGFIKQVIQFYINEFDYFLLKDEYIDKFDLYTLQEYQQMQNVNRIYKQKTVRVKNTYSVFFNNEARAWSKGMHLSVLSTLLRQNLKKWQYKIVKGKQLKILESCLNDDVDDDNVRSLSHILLGYADYLHSAKKFSDAP